METAPNQLHEALAKVMAGIERMPKDAANPAQHYRYTSVNAILDALRGPLAEEGVTIVQSYSGILSDSTAPTKSGATMREVLVEFDYILTHAPSGTRETWRFAGVGSDTGDKWFSKASTSAAKYFLLRLFQISSGDEEPDAGGYEREGAASPAQNEPWAPTPAQVKLVWGKGKGNDIDFGDIRAMIWAITGGRTAEPQNIPTRANFDALITALDEVKTDPSIQERVQAFLEEYPMPTRERES